MEDIEGKTYLTLPTACIYKFCVIIKQSIGRICFKQLIRWLPRHATQICRIIIQGSNKEEQKYKEFLMKYGLVTEKKTKEEPLAVLIVEGREHSASGRAGFRVTRQTAKCFCDVVSAWTPASITNSSR